MFLYIALCAAMIIAVAVGIVLILAASKPNIFRVQRTASIHAAPEKIFPLINDFHSWSAWSPFEKLDSAMKKTYSGAAQGTGAIYEWAGNAKAGVGRMEITASAPPAKITIKLDFLKPFPGHNIVEFTLQPNGSATETTWAMHGPVPFVGKIFHVFINMDRMVGGSFEEGLANLKSVAEK